MAVGSFSCFSGGIGDSPIVFNQEFEERVSPYGLVCDRRLELESYVAETLVSVPTIQGEQRLKSLLPISQRALLTDQYRIIADAGIPVVSLMIEVVRSAFQ
jgi:hypothetical protein